MTLEAFGFIVAAFVLLVAVPACARWEAHQDQLDAEAWAEMPGATR